MLEGPNYPVLCRACKYYRLGKKTTYGEKREISCCTHAFAFKESKDLITGEPVVEWKGRCHWMREAGPCGTPAKLFKSVDLPVMVRDKPSWRNLWMPPLRDQRRIPGEFSEEKVIAIYKKGLE